eukprot:GHRQ01006498.1.p1 GENE.GHRQ01006498.1~~GHRQ01006498.1.p1  ORF type:complete len:314 (+),score=40.13 GHRQ01006498.1:534-1475(+)
MPWWIPTRTQCQTTAPGGPNGLALQTQTCTHMASTPHQECPARQQQRYQGHDNIFVKLAARSSAAQRPISLTFTGELSKDHLPGLHWGHAHKHGSSFIQVSSAHFAIIVDDDFEAWMPQAAAPGCSQVRKMLEGAPDTIIDLQLFFFKYAADPLNVNNANANLDDANFQIASKNSSNPYCCGRGQNGRNVFTNTLTRGLGGNRFLINGGYQPRISLQHNTWQRWRFLYSGAKVCSCPCCHAKCKGWCWQRVAGWSCWCAAPHTLAQSWCCQQALLQARYSQTVTSPTPSLQQATRSCCNRRCWQPSPCSFHLA